MVQLVQFVSVATASVDWTLIVNTLSAYWGCIKASTCLFMPVNAVYVHWVDVTVASMAKVVYPLEDNWNLSAAEVLWSDIFVSADAWSPPPPTAETSFDPRRLNNSPDLPIAHVFPWYPSPFAKLAALGTRTYRFPSASERVRGKKRGSERKDGKKEGWNREEQDQWIKCRPSLLTVKRNALISSLPGRRAWNRPATERLGFCFSESNTFSFEWSGGTGAAIIWALFCFPSSRQDPSSERNWRKGVI